MNYLKRKIELLILVAAAALVVSASAPPAKEKASVDIQSYGSKAAFHQGRGIVFPDFELTYLGERHVPSRVFKPGFLHYEFQVKRDDLAKTIYWTSGTGDIGPSRFEIGGLKFSLEMRRSDRLGKLRDDELAVWMSGEEKHPLALRIATRESTFRLGDYARPGNAIPVEVTVCNQSTHPVTIPTFCGPVETNPKVYFEEFILNFQLLRSEGGRWTPAQLARPSGPIREFPSPGPRELASGACWSPVIDFSRWILHRDIIPGDYELSAVWEVPATARLDESYAEVAGKVQSNAIRLHFSK